MDPEQDIVATHNSSQNGSEALLPPGLLPGEVSPSFSATNVAQSFSLGPGGGYLDHQMSPRQVMVPSPSWQMSVQHRTPHPTPRPGHPAAQHRLQSAPPALRSVPASPAPTHRSVHGQGSYAHPPQPVFSASQGMRSVGSFGVPPGHLVAAPTPRTVIIGAGARSVSPVQSPRARYRGVSASPGPLFRNVAASPRLTSPMPRHRNMASRQPAHGAAVTMQSSFEGPEGPQIRDERQSKSPDGSPAKLTPRGITPRDGPGRGELGRVPSWADGELIFQPASLGGGKCPWTFWTEDDNDKEGAQPAADAFTV